MLVVCIYIYIVHIAYGTHYTHSKEYNINMRCAFNDVMIHITIMWKNKNQCSFALLQTRRVYFTICNYPRGVNFSRSIIQQF